MDIRRRVGLNVKRLRKERDLSQEQLAFECRRHRTYISGIERGVRNPTILVLEVIANALKVPAYVLLEEDRTVSKTSEGSRLRSSRQRTPSKRLRTQATAPRTDLTDGSGGLDPLAFVKVTAAMCHPNDQLKRHQMLALAEAEFEPGPAKRPRITDDEFEQQFEHAAYTGGRISGALLMNLVQLHCLSQKASVNRAVELLHYLLPEWEQPTGDDWPAPQEEPRTPMHRQKILKIFREFLPVCHLWAATLYGMKEERPEILPFSNAAIPAFIGYAEEFADMASRVRWHGKDRRVLLPADIRWPFKLPSSLIVTPKIEALRLEDEQEEVLRRFHKR